MTHNPFKIARWPAGLYQAGQLRATLEYTAGPLDLAALFGRSAPVLLEIGTGHGHFFLETARARPDWNLLGIELSRSRVDSVSRRAARLQIPNVLILNALAELALDSLIPKASVRELHIHFPDPWPKKRHHKRRFLGPDFVPKLAAVLEPGGLLCVMTDHEGYAADGLAALEATGAWLNLAGAGAFVADPEEPRTRFQELAVEQGRRIFHLRLQTPRLPES